MTNQRELAKSLGISQATVARALSNSRLVNPVTRERVLKAAVNLGYRENPMVKSLMQQVRTGQPTKEIGNIALLINAAVSEQADIHVTYENQYLGIERYAENSGFKTERFYYRDSRCSSDFIDRVLFSRGYLGVILSAPFGNEAKSIKLNWDRYAMAAISYDFEDLPIDRASTNHHFNVSHAFETLVAKGYQRIGIVLPNNAVRGQHGNWLAGYLYQQQFVQPENRLPICVGSVADTPTADFEKWFLDSRPDAIITLVGEEVQWLEQLGISIPEQVAVICLNIPPGSDFSGMDENNISVGEMACRAVANSIINNAKGFPNTPALLQINGCWVDGGTA